ncbi:MAG: hypothetical protein ACXAC2_13930 [Candidatus Kariarchaeaceae archaeon]|jgi:hypothetical protein
MVKHQKYGTYEHLCVVIFAQGTWNERDREYILKPIREKHNEKRDDPYHFYQKLTRRDVVPLYSDCQLCRPIYELFEEIKCQTDAFLFQGHHYLILEDDVEDLKDFVKETIDNDKVKKIYLLYLDSLKEIKRTIINSMKLPDFKELITQKQVNISEFINILSEGNFNNRTVYEIIKY